MLEIVRIRAALGDTVIAGFISGAHLGYLNSTQQVLQELYGLGNRFPLYFAVVALSIGSASFLNARLVMRYGMRSLIWWSLLLVSFMSFAAMGIALISAGKPPLWLLMVYLIVNFFCVGFLFGNNNSLALQPLGRVAGIGAAGVGSLSTRIAFPLGIRIGRSYNGTIFPLVAGTAILTGLSILVVRWIELN